MALVDAMSAALAEDRAQRVPGPHIGLERHTWRVVLDVATCGTDLGDGFATDITTDPIPGRDLLPWQLPGVDGPVWACSQRCAIAHEHARDLTPAQPAPHPTYGWWPR